MGEVLERNPPKRVDMVEVGGVEPPSKNGVGLYHMGVNRPAYAAEPVDTVTPPKGGERLLAACECSGQPLPEGLSLLPEVSSPSLSLPSLPPKGATSYLSGVLRGHAPDQVTLRGCVGSLSPDVAIVGMVTLAREAAANSLVGFEHIVHLLGVGVPIAVDAGEDVAQFHGDALKLGESSVVAEIFHACIIPG